MPSCSTSGRPGASRATRRPRRWSRPRRGALALVVAAPAAASEQHPTLLELESQVMCPVCAGETLAQSDSPAARQVKRNIQKWIDGGSTRSEIKRKLVAEYGPQILAAP